MSKRNKVIFHHDGTVSYWCALQHAWVSHEDAELADMDTAPTRRSVPEAKDYEAIGRGYRVGTAYDNLKTKPAQCSA